MHQKTALAEVLATTLKPNGKPGHFQVLCCERQADDGDREKRQWNADNGDAQQQSAKDIGKHNQEASEDKPQNVEYQRQRPIIYGRLPARVSHPAAPLAAHR
jgi:hypothetical protein